MALDGISICNRPRTQKIIDVVVIPPAGDLQSDEEEFYDNIMSDDSTSLMPQEVAGEVELQHIISSESEDSDREYHLPLSVLREIILKQKALENKEKSCLDLNGLIIL
ncbi:unnamed protein product [Acanthoscelides obtectus]|uniref:Uncharacterized protein n=1 Tax=Acanthoscelides obtectus TaxID=200917 RepID=A0A9P0KDJ5_ACAOB|nr:unnamed protein product [Acanthoscelides obtectus]CAK1680323.1 hypothetical protein AOBTE_LOCUS32578 [Acanthoscelides obtectus]